MSVDNILQQIKNTKLGNANGSRQVQLYITGDSFLPPSQDEIKGAFQSQGWNILDVTVISPVISAFRGSKITVTANVLNEFPDNVITQNARNIMSNFVTNPSVTIVKGQSLTANQILGNDQTANNLFKGIGLSVGTIATLAVLGVIIIKKI